MLSATPHDSYIIALLVGRAIRVNSGFDILGENPIDMVEDVLNPDERLHLTRPSPQELLIVSPGQWAQYRLHCIWQIDLQALHTAALMDLTIEPANTPKITELLCLINSRLWIGHFEFSDEGTAPVFRHGHLLRGQGGIAREQVEDLIEVAIGECDRFYPAFQIALLTDQSPAEALQAALIETVGQA